MTSNLANISSNYRVFCSILILNYPENPNSSVKADTPFQSTSEKGLTCMLPAEETNTLKDRNPVKSPVQKVIIYFLKKKKEQRKNRKKSTEKRIFTIHITINS